MSCCHYWELDSDIDQESFARIVADVQRIILTLDDRGVRLAGPLGEGLPEIDANHIAFNGLYDCGHPKMKKLGSRLRRRMPLESAVRANAVVLVLRVG